MTLSFAPLRNYLFPPFSRTEILKEQLKLLEANLLIGLLAYTIIVLITAASVYYTSEVQGIFFWLFRTLLIPLFGGWYVHRMASRDIAPEVKATRMTLLLVALGLTWAGLPLGFLDVSNSSLTINITCITAGLVAGALTMQSPCLPVFLGFLYPVMGSLIVAFMLNGTPLSYLHAAACLVYLIVLNIFGFNLEKMVKHSIELRFDNLDLIDKLRNAMEIATEADRAKSVFLASASHDLRQPLHAIGLFTQTLSGSELNPLQRTVLSRIETATDATREMLNTLLNFSKVEAGVIEPSITTFRLKDLFQRLEMELAVSASNKQLQYRTHASSLIVETDSQLLELILRNLITNAIRYTHKGGILIGARQRGEQAMIEVWDTGIGIAAEHSESIFREFHQLENPERNREKGFGLGLAIVSGLCTTLQLTTSVASTPGKGSVFRILVPLGRKPIVEDLSSETVIEKFNNPRILIIDDDEAIRSGMTALLEIWGCQCMAFESAEEALEVLRESHQIPDLVITDYRLRDNQTGNDVLDILRTSISHNLKAIMITGDTAADRLRKARKSQALLLHKPVSSKDLYKAMASLLPTL